jgi:hypothetical protein
MNHKVMPGMVTAEEQTGLSHRELRQQLKHCPFCARRPDFEDWHGGEPTTVRIGCTAQYIGQCDVVPSTVGDTWTEAKRTWNRRRQP